MRKCSNECLPGCDFCIAYDYNGDENGCYTNNGWCNRYKVNKDPGDYCDDYICFNLIRKEENKK